MRFASSDLRLELKFLTNSKVITLSNQETIDLKTNDLLLKRDRNVLVDIAVSVAADYRNPSLIAWEPFVEPSLINIGCDIPVETPNVEVIWAIETFSIFESQDEESFEKSSSALHAPSSSVSANELSLRILMIEIKDVLNLNITVPLFEVLLSNMLGVMRFINKIDEKVEKTRDLSIAVIRNESGLKLSYTVSKDSPRVDIPMNTEVPLVFEDTDFLYPNMEMNPLLHRRITLTAETSEGLALSPPMDISMEGRGSSIFTLELINRKSSKSREKQAIFSIVKFHDKDTIFLVAERKNLPGGAKMLLIRSTLRVCNSSPIFFRVLLLNNSEVIWEETLSPSSDTYVPSQICNISHGQLLFQAVNTKRSTEPLLEVELPIPELPGSSKPDELFSTFNSKGNGFRWRYYYIQNVFYSKSVLYEVIRNLLGVV